jgi:predicted PurR-regulated permease PerM
MSISKNTSNNPNIAILSVIALLLLMAFLKLAQVIVLPFVLSIFLSFLLLPIIYFLQKKGVPAIISALFSLGIVFILLFTLSSLLTVSLKSLGQALPSYFEKFEFLAFEMTHFIKQYGIELNAKLLLDNIDSTSVASLAGQSLSFILGIMKYSVLVFFITLFMLLEASRFKDKAIKAFGKGNIFDDSTAQVGKEIAQYLGFKTLMSLTTGILVWAFLTLMGLDFPLVWGLLAFILNFIPSVGSIVASIPPILLALLQFESPFKMFVIVTIGLLLIHISIGNYLDPKIMGDNLNLSTLIIFLSMVFWGWMWGPLGMLIAVPLAVCIKVALAHNARTKPISIMMED